MEILRLRQARELAHMSTNAEQERLVMELIARLQVQQRQIELQQWQIEQQQQHEPSAAQSIDPDSLASLKLAAEQGDAAAQNNLGGMYYYGDGVPQDKPEAAKWTRKAAEQRNVRAQVLLGLLYYDGDVVPQDYTEAAKWFQEAATCMQDEDKVGEELIPAQIAAGQEWADQLQERISEGQ